MIENGKRLPAEIEARLIAAYQQLSSITRAAQTVGIHRETASKYIRRWQANQPAAAAPEPTQAMVAEPEQETYQRVEEGDTAQIDLKSPERITTEQDAIRFAQVDLSVWRVKRWSCTSWETGMKLRQFDEAGKVIAERPHRTHQFRVHLDLERILPRPLQDATNAVWDSMRDHAPRYPKLGKRSVPKRPHLAIVDLFDVHVGKLCWAPETGTDYDLKIAEQLYRRAMVDILHESAGREIAQFVLPVGQDFFHIDGPGNMTTNGTPQDTDGRLAKILATGERAVIWAIEQLAAIAPVRVLYVPGNHDRLLSYCLMRTLSAWFRLSDRVEVDVSPKTRKAHRFGNSLLAFTHGDSEKTSSLAAIMANEFKEDFCATDCHEWHRGHMHRPKRIETTPVNFQDGVVIRDLHALSGIDSWHYRMGYVGGTRAAEAYFYALEGGFVAQYVARVRGDK